VPTDGTQSITAKVAAPVGERHGNRDRALRARCKTGMTNLVYNMRRFVCFPFATPSNFV
jgi:hypothetical protein